MNEKGMKVRKKWNELGGGWKIGSAAQGRR